MKDYIGLEQAIMQTRIKDIKIMNTICEQCYEKDKELQILIIKETPKGLNYNLVCVDCSTKFKTGDTLK